MTIYPEISFTHLPITVRCLINPVRLYVKQCPHCELLYFGKSIRNDIENYQGSGDRWINHLKKYKVKPITIMISEWFFDYSVCKIAKTFSIENKIVDSESWANIVIENGIDGGNLGEKALRKQRQTLNDPIWIETVGKPFRKKQGKKRSITVNDPIWIETVGKPSRERQAETLKETISSPIWKENIGKPAYKKAGKKQSETKQSVEWKNTFGIEIAKKQSETKQSDEWKQKNWKTCEYCGKYCNPGNYKRWHGNNCKCKNSKNSSMTIVTEQEQMFQ